MGNRKPIPGKEETETKPKPETNRYLTASQYFLNVRNFTDSKKYALRARESDPFHPAPNQIISIASVLSAPDINPTRKDYYSILNLAPFESDPARIESRFKALTSILNPNSNPYPLSSEAFDLVLEAWSVLSNPVQKVKFDELLRFGVSGGGDGTFGSECGTFWTMCPYCYYVYEYEKSFEECSLRCVNERCRRGFHAVAIPAPPPPEVVEKGQYLCPGFVLCSYGDENKGNMWVPFVPNVSGVSKDDCNYNEYLIDISDDEMKVKGHGNGEKPIKVDEECSNGEFMKNGVKDGGVRRKKSVAWDSRKVMGKGIRVDRGQGFINHGTDEEHHLNVDGNECAVFGVETSNGVDSEVEFFEGDDDVLVGFQFDMGNGDI